MTIVILVITTVVTLTDIAHAGLAGYQAQSERYQFGSQFLRPQQERYSFGGFNSITNNFPGSVDLQKQFLNLFDVNGVTKMAGSCIPRFIGDLAKVQKMCPKDDFFFAMNPRHVDAVHAVTRLMSSPPTVQANICVASQLKNSYDMNPQVWMRSLMSMVFHNDQLRSLQRPALFEMYPSMFIHSSAMDEVKRLAALPPHLRGDSCVLVDGSYGIQNGPENALWYFREDVMLNAHHWYWHLANPFMPVPAADGLPLPRRPDRRGELFDYMHLSLLARYHSERLANRLPKVVPIDITYSTVIEEPYYANLDGTASGRRWTDRQPNAHVQDIFFNTVPDTPMNISVGQRLLNLNRILESIESGRLITSNNDILPLDNFNGIDFLGEIIEASVYSVNPKYYGAFGIHNAGHFILGLIQDPNGINGLPPGVMSDPTVAMRDPLFYRYHLTISKLVENHKVTLPPYQLTEGEFPLLWAGVTIQDVKVIPVNQRSPVANELTTFFSHVTYDLSRGLDFNRSAVQGPINACVRHLDYEHFEYQISITKNPKIASNLASIRIFMAPRYDENGRRYNMHDQRSIFFALDYFTARLNPGENIIRRRSIDSSLTTSWPQRFEELQQANFRNTPDCGCGYPDHLLLPKGTPEGMIFDLFVMATNGEDDAVPLQPIQVGPGGSQRRPTCIPAPVYCGVPGQLYPDSKPMGYPFNRLPYSLHEPELDEYNGIRYSHEPRVVNTLEDYTEGISNAVAIKVRITHLDH